MMNSITLVSSCGGSTLCIHCCDYAHCGSTPKGKSRSFGRLLCYVFMAVVASLLLCSGDVETNPGPPECEYID